MTATPDSEFQWAHDYGMMFLAQIGFALAYLLWREWSSIRCSAGRVAERGRSEAAEFQGMRKP